MADFALGLTKSAVEGTLSRVKSAIEEEAKLKEKVEQDLVFIICEFQMMQSFLEAAKSERAMNKVASTWVRQLRDLAFDVENCVEFVVHLDKNPAWWWRVVPSCVAPPRHLDEAAAEIKLLKARVEDLSHRYMRYNLITDSGSHSKRVMPTSSPSAFDNLRQVWEAAGKIREMGDLQDLIIREGSDLQVISVWGSTGDDFGLTSIFRKAFCDRKICQEFKSRAWVKLMHPFNPDEFLKTLLTQFYESSHRADVDFSDLKKAQLMQQVMEHKYLIIVEDVSTLVEWNAIKICLPENMKGSRIVVSTQDLGIALLCPGEPYLVSELGRFSDGKSLCAFFKRASGRRSDMGELKWQIKCRGVISMHGSATNKSIIVRRLYRGIKHKREVFDGVEFGMHRWVHVVHPFDLVDLSRRLFLDLSSYGFNDDDLEKILHNLDMEPQTEDDIKAVLEMGEQDLTEGCRRFLRENDGLIVIDGLRSRDDWNMIKSTFLSEPIKGCILVITNEEYVATHCVDNKDRALNSNCLVSQGLAQSTRKEEARDWTNSFELLRSEDSHITKILELRPASVSSVWGIPGVGKSALVRSVYYRVMLGLLPVYGLSKFHRPRQPLARKFTAYSWVDVPHPFNFTEFCRRLLLDFHSDDLQAKETAMVGIIEGQDPIQGCRLFLREHECFVVVDGLRSTDDWDLIKATFLSRPIAGNIFVITNEASVAKHCVDDKFLVVSVKGLNTQSAFGLFKKTVASNGKKLAPEVVPQSKLIVDKCRGIPKLIVAIGNHALMPYLYFLRSLNGDFMGKLETDPGFHDLRDLFSWMHSYFDACSDSLKPCIFYLSAFSTDQNFRRKRLLRRWVAEGYSRDTFNSAAEKNGDRLFSELVGWNIIQCFEYPRSMKNQCQVNGFFHEYIISRPMEDNLVFALEGRCGLNSQRTGQHLTIRRNWDRDREMTVFENMDFSRLRSLTVFGEWRPFFISANIKMRLLRVLDLEDTSGVRDGDLDQIGKLLPRLKFLSLRGCREVSHLPHSLGDLRQLQTLDIRHTSIATLPQAIIKLQRLQYIRAGTTNPFDEGGTVTSLPATDEDTRQTIADDSEPEATAPAPAPEEHGDGKGPSQSAEAAEGMVHTSTTSHTLLSSWLSKFCQRRRLDNGGVVLPAPAGFGSLMALRTLGVINVGGAGGKAVLKELKKLTQLRKLGLCGVSQKNWKEFSSVISGHGHLESLWVHVDKDKEQGFFCCFDDISPPPITLKSLKLHGHVRTLPGWIKRHDNLEKLDLEMTNFTQEDMHVFDDLSGTILHRLLVRPNQDGALHFSRLPYDHPLDNFEVLEIDCTSTLKVTFGPWMAYYVRQLLVHCSSGSSFQISGLGRLQCLDEVWLKGSYSDALKRDLQQQLSEHPGKPVLKLVQPRSF